MSIKNRIDKKEFLSVLKVITNKFPHHFKEENITAIYLKKLNDADIVQANKDKSSNGKTSHIACTGTSMHFFYDIIGDLQVNDNFSNEENSKFPILTFNHTDKTFVKSQVAIWINPKSGGNQIGISKDRIDGDEFKEFRKRIYPKDFLLLFKYVNDQTNQIEVYGVHIPKDDPSLDSFDFDTSKKAMVKYYEQFDKQLNIDIKEENVGDINLIGFNRLFYGAPGSGKSFLVKQEYEDSYAVRILFHNDFSYADFVGYIKPIIINENNSEKLVYKFERGPFTNILISALKDPLHMHTLIIEEINRANAPSVFGDLFQLLDRDEMGKSDFQIENKDIFDEIKKEIGDDYSPKEHNIYIPNNLRIIGTMNNSDQNTIPLDTAFKRRWQFEYIPINFENHPYKDTTIANFGVTWEKFCNEINSFMLSENNIDLMITEDKQIGQYFLKKRDLEDFNLFSYKVLLYLWDDVFKHNRTRIFKSHILSFTQLIEEAKSHGVQVFVDDVVNRLIDFGDTLA